VSSLTAKAGFRSYQTHKPAILLGEMARRLDCALIGDPELTITGVSTLEKATPSELSFLSNPKYKRQLGLTNASAIITDNPSLIPAEKSALISSNPYLTFALALEIFSPQLRFPPGIHPTALISKSAVIGTNVSIGPFAFIGDHVVIGDDVVIHSHCVIYPESVIGNSSLIYSHCIIRERSVIGRNVILQNNVTIGTDGFGYARKTDRSWRKIPQTGIVVIEDQVEIGAGSVIDRSTIGSTVIRRGSKIDNLVQIGHGCMIGENVLLCAQAGLAGSTVVGNEVILGGQTGAAGHLTIGDRVVATAQTGIPSSVPPDTVISGYPAINNRDWLKSSAIFAQLPKLLREINHLKRQVAELERMLSNDQPSNRADSDP
jgi:UDP-3-O-[3-hydroxymyristoyl] glucosamine N-acyltransferase